VLGLRRIGRVECGAKAVPFGLRESDPAAHEVLDLGVVDHQRLELIPVECPGFGLAAGQWWQGGWFLRLRRAAESFSE
jgi:hypothetical protein